MLVLYLISARLLIAQPFYHWHNSIRSVQTDVSRFPAGNTILSKHISNCYVVPGLPILNPICFMAYCQLTIWSSPNHPALVKAVRSFRWTEMDNPCDTVRYSMTYWRSLTYKVCNNRPGSEPVIIKILVWGLQSRDQEKADNLNVSQSPFHLCMVETC